MSAETEDQFRDLLDRWEELRQQGTEPSVEELCSDAPHLAERLREWTGVLKSADWLNRPADEVADETLGEPALVTGAEGAKQRVIGEYTLLEEVGGGGMGRVFKALHRKMDRTVALKLLPQSLVQTPGSVQRFQREIQALARLSHPNIVAVHDAGEADGTHYYVMDLVAGEDLARRVKQHGPLPIEQAVDCMLQVARGLEYAHAQGIVHRDIKPSNLIADQDGVVKILDLGIARFQPLPDQAAGDDLTKTGCVLGTIDYLAPEQAVNTRLADHRADIYSLGCTLHFLLTGQPLFGGDTVMERLVAHREHPVPSLRKTCPAVPPWLDGIFQKMVAKKPEDRYQSVAALVSDLQRRSAPCRRRRLPLWVTIVLALILVGTLGLILTWTLPYFQHGGEVKKPLELPVKPTWRMTGEYPLIAGVWSTAEKGTLVTIVQHEEDFIATSTHLSDGETISWRAEGRIGHGGHLTMNFVHTEAHPTQKRPPQTRTAVLSLDGKSLEGYAAFEGGGHVFTWNLLTPHDAEPTELSK